jgi:hypothetical protein
MSHEIHEISGVHDHIVSPCGSNSLLSRLNNFGPAVAIRKALPAGERAGADLRGANENSVANE